MTEQWKRRDVLRVLTAVGATPLATTLGCSGGGAQLPTTSRQPVLPPDLAAQLKRAVQSLARFGKPSAFARIKRTWRTLLDADHRILAPTQSGFVVLSVTSGKHNTCHVTDDLSPQGLKECVDRFSKLSPTRSRSIDFGTPRTFAAAPQSDPRSVADEDWLARTTSIYDAAQRIGGTRVVYRSASIATDDVETFSVSDGQDLRQRVVRTRANVSLVVWTGAALVENHVGTGAMGGVDQARISAHALEQLAADSLSSLTARPATDSLGELVLAPEVGALFVAACVAPALDTTAWHTGSSVAERILRGEGSGAFASPLVHIADDPGLAGAYGGYHFDDEGTSSGQSALVAAGQLASPLTTSATANALNITNTGNATVTPTGSRAEVSNMTLRAGSTPPSQLIGAVTRGFVVEGAMSANVDPVSWQFAVRAARAREVVGGRLTGRAHHSVTLRGTVPQLLLQVRGLSNTTVRIPFEREQRAITSASPHIFTRGRITA